MTTGNFQKVDVLYVHGISFDWRGAAELFITVEEEATSAIMKITMGKT